MTKDLSPADQAAIEALDRGIAELRKRIDQMIAEFKEEARLMKAEHKGKLAAARADLRNHEKSRSSLLGEKRMRRVKPQIVEKEAVA